jgi:phosphoglycolate phosphatase
MTRPALLLDLDGTIIDSRPGIVASLRAALRDLGHVPDPDQDLTWIIGPPMEQVIGRLLAPFGDDRTQLAVDRYRANYARDGLAGNAVYPGMAAAIAELAGSHDLFLCTAKRTRFAVPILENLGLAGHFRGIHGSEDDGRFDDKAVLAAHILAAHGVGRACAGLAGDRLHDIEAAHANHIPAIGVAWGYGGRAELAAAGATVVVSDAEELVGAVRARRLFGHQV